MELTYYPNWVRFNLSFKNEALRINSITICRLKDESFNYNIIKNQEEEKTGIFVI